MYLTIMCFKVLNCLSKVNCLTNGSYFRLGWGRRRREPTRMRRSPAPSPGTASRSNRAGRGRLFGASPASEAARFRRPAAASEGDHDVWRVDAAGASAAAKMRRLSAAGCGRLAYRQQPGSRRGGLKRRRRLFRVLRRSLRASGRWPASRRRSG